MTTTTDFSTVQTRDQLPQIDLRHLLRLTDQTGIFQHALYTTPDPKHGYCIDDNARALIAALLHADLCGDNESSMPLRRYLEFISRAFNENHQAFRNFMSHDGHWLEEIGSDDSQGRTIWALGLAVRLAPDDAVRGRARSLLIKAMASLQNLQYPRSWAFVLIGLHEFLRYEPRHQRAADLRDQLAMKLFDALKEHSADHWPWWEPLVTYDNAKLPHALLLSGQAMRRADMVTAAMKSLRWLLQIQTPNGHLSSIGNNGWYRRDGSRARFDQQPLEAYALVHACLTVAEMTAADPAWANHAQTCFQWFLGDNDLGVPLYDEHSSGCQDGLQSDRPNRNQGAESTLAYLLSLLELHKFYSKHSHRNVVTRQRTIGYAVVGASRFADFCLENYAHLTELRPVAVWSRTATAAERCARRHGVKIPASLEELLNDPEIDLIHVAGIPAIHSEHAMAALNRNKHVLVEKPITIKLDDATRMIETASARHVALSVNFVMRYGPLAQPIRQLVNSKLLGAVLHANFTNCAGDLPEDHWFWRKQDSGGIFVEHGVHFFDLARYWLGEATVQGATLRKRPHTGVIDQVTALLQFDEQTEASFYHGFCHSPHLDRQNARIIFERGDVRLSGWISQELHIEAVLAEKQIAQVMELFPEAHLSTLETMPSETTVHRRHRVERADRHIMLFWQSPDDKQRIYGRAIQALMQDMLHGISDRAWIPRVGAEDGRAALELALQADLAAHGVGS